MRLTGFCEQKLFKGHGIAGIGPERVNAGRYKYGSDYMIIGYRLEMTQRHIDNPMSKSGKGLVNHPQIQ